MIWHSGGCHCGAVRFQVEAPKRIEVGDCNCSMCSRTGYQHLMAQKERFRLLSGEDALTSYQFKDGRNREKHYPAGRGEYE